MVKNATNADVRNPRVKMRISLRFTFWSKPKTININAPEIAGIANKNANLEPSFRLKPKMSAPVIKTPDLEAPGKKAKIWKKIQMRWCNYTN